MIDLGKIHKGMDVMTSDGQRLGTVRDLLEHVLFLDDVELASDRDRSSVPLIWVLSVDTAIRLAKHRSRFCGSGRQALRAASERSSMGGPTDGPQSQHTCDGRRP